MSTMMDSVAGKGRNLSTNVWIALLVVSLVVFAGNTVVRHRQGVPPRRRQYLGIATCR